jgi:hypothetical protein
MLSLVYVSSATQLFSDEDLKALLAQSRDKNKRLGITGLLLYKDGNFMQVLEGAEDAVLATYASIQADTRHHGILELIRQPVQEREFASWSMGFKNLKDVNLNEPLTSTAFQADPSRAQKLLRMFRTKM